MGKAMFDYPRIALIVGGIAVVIAMACMIAIGVANSSSRNISLAIGTVFGALLLLIIQLFFELQPAKSVAVLRTDFTIDKANLKIEQFRYPIGPAMRFSDESDANKLLVEKNPAAFQNPDKLWKDMSLFSLVLYLWNEQHDWQIARDVLGTFEKFQYLSAPNQTNQCTKIEFSQIQLELRKIDNFFADYKPHFSSIFPFMCLPPGSSINIEPNKITLTTPYCEIRFDVEDMIMATYSTPGTQQPLFLENGKPRFETRQGVIRMTISYDRFRAQSRLMPKYQTWANDVVERARKWFSTEITQNAFVSDFN